LSFFSIPFFFVLVSFFLECVRSFSLEIEKIGFVSLFLRYCVSLSLSIRKSFLQQIQKDRKNDFIAFLVNGEKEKRGWRQLLKKK